eukprot:CAMPEP_0172160230 /NCGR_PEP_ID=MMETSP1050-20130122/5442_1 /TAXON_ID=233186 /ORGANISM="Cryptomonas curvata, Strain CCAP979/52" /LENGTH=58 /DNA_ID=CAMNT_0012829969 /DNA_START=223 /DNA_END=399 /DNA_ORIENTATION=-
MSSICAFATAPAPLCSTDADAPRTDRCAAILAAHCAPASFPPPAAQVLSPSPPPTHLV